MAEWRDIETAPKDGRGLLLIDMAAEKPEAGYGCYIFECWSCIDGEMAREGDEALFRSLTWVSPTHWRPLPAPPEQSK